MIGRNWLLILCLLVACLTAELPAQSPAGAARDWENPAVFKRNQEEPHATLMPYASVQEALGGDRSRSAHCQSLDGTWKFHWAGTPVEAPADFYKPGYDDSRWNEITVPSNMEMVGFGHPLFRNVHQPFPATPPTVPSDYNPVGSYRRTFVVPETWKGQQIFLHFEGVHSASYVWVNGRQVGYNQGGMEPAEYDITRYLQPGRNSLAVQVYRYSDGTYLECQDMWRLSGIFRHVYLMATPPVHIRDLYVVTDLDDHYRDATLRITAEIKNYSSAAVGGYKLRAQLYDASRQPVLPAPLVSSPASTEPSQTLTVSLEQAIQNPAKWSAEKPNLYTLSLELVGPNGQATEVLSNRVGFRKVEVKNQAVCINGVAVKFSGVNSHMQHPKSGHTMDVATIRQDLTIMKQFNINCVRTSHYPPNVEYLELADELGMYIVDETGDEAHATEYLSEDPAWQPAYIDRAVRMVKRDRNHPSVVIWSAGNESGSGQNIAALIREGKKLDPSRPAWCYGGNDDLLPFEDIVGPRYPTPEELEQVGQVPPEKDPRPSFLDEYLAVTGNGMGNLDEFWDVIYRYPRLTGGAIWDWPSPGISARWITTPDASPGKVDAALMAGAHLVPGRFGSAVALSGHDEWVEVYRDPSLDINGTQITLDAWIYPRSWNGTSPFITKGDHQFGLLQSSRNELEFYIQDGGRVSVKAPVPEKWEFQWHHLAGIYDGETLQLYLDGRIVATTAHRGRIAESPYPVNIGRNAELHGMEHPGQLCNAVIDQVRIYPRALTPAELAAPGNELSGQAILALDFDETVDAGPFFSLGIGARPYGLIWPDRTVQPEMWQLKKTPQPVRIEALDLGRGRLRFTNRYSFSNLAELDGVWTLTGDDEVLQGGSVKLDLEPGKSREVEISLQPVTRKPGVEYRLLVSFRLPNATAWAPKDHEVAWEQFELPAYTPAPSGTSHKPALSVGETADRVTVSGKHLVCQLDKKTGALSSIRIDGKELLKQGPRLNAWRAPTWNETERDWGGQPIVDQWRACGLDRLRTSVKSVQTRKTGDNVEVAVKTTASAPGSQSGFASSFTYTFLPSEDVLVEHQVEPFGQMPDWLPKIGMQLELPEEFQQFSWYGRGPAETYPDRKTGMKVGIYSGTVDEQYSPYLVPEDFGNKTDVRWAALSNGTIGLLVSGDSLLNVSAHHFTTDDLSRALYTPQLKKQDGITLNVDYRIAGVGDTPRKLLPKYQIKPSTYRYTVRLRPYRAGETPLQLGREAGVVRTRGGEK